jgi:hypothetical protein
VKQPSARQIQEMRAILKGVVEGPDERLVNWAYGSALQLISVGAAIGLLVGALLGGLVVIAVR